MKYLMKLNEKIRLVLTTARCCREINPDQVKITPIFARSTNHHPHLKILQQSLSRNQRKPYPKILDSVTGASSRWEAQSLH